MVIVCVPVTPDPPRNQIRVGACGINPSTETVGALSNTASSVEYVGVETPKTAQLKGFCQSPLETSVRQYYLIVSCAEPGPGATRATKATAAGKAERVMVGAPRAMDATVAASSSELA
jgi:hypothetical protein